MADAAEEVVAEELKTPEQLPSNSQELDSRPKPRLDSFSGVDWTKVPEDAREALQSEMDRRISAAKANERRRTKKEVEAFYQGRESVAAPQRQVPRDPNLNNAPDRDSFSSYEGYVEALAVYAAEKAANTTHERLSKRVEEDKKIAAKVALRTEFEQRTKSKYPDIEDRVSEIGHMLMHEEVQEAIAESEF